jgi:hypothetical protein
MLRDKIFEASIRKFGSKCLTRKERSEIGTAKFEIGFHALRGEIDSGTLTQDR